MIYVQKDIKAIRVTIMQLTDQLCLIPIKYYD